MKQPWKFVALLSACFNVLLFVIAVCNAQSHNQQIADWQEAARPAAIKRGLVGDNMTPAYLKSVLCEKCAATHYEASKLFVYGNHAYHNHP